MQPSHGCVDVLQRIDHLGAELAELPSGDDEHIGAAQEGTEDSCHGFGDTGLGRGQGVVEIEGDNGGQRIVHASDGINRAESDNSRSTPAVRFPVPLNARPQDRCPACT